MHIADGIVSLPVLLATSSAAGIGVAIGMRGLQPADMPRTAMMTTALFLGSLLHIPAGPVQFHLLLNGLAGLLLGWRIFPALAITLLLQASLFGYGGLSTLGVNLFVMGLPGLGGCLISRAVASLGTRKAVIIAGAVAGFVGVSGAIALTLMVLMLSDRSYASWGYAIASLNVPLIFVETVATSLIVSFLHHAKPEIFLPKGAA